MKLSQIQMFWKAHRRIADANELFLDLVKDGLTANELKTNIRRRPSIWKRFENWLPKLP